MLTGDWADPALTLWRLHMNSETTVPSLGHTGGIQLGGLRETAGAAQGTFRDPSFLWDLLFGDCGS